MWCTVFDSISLIVCNRSTSIQKDDYLLTVNTVHFLQTLDGCPGDEKAHMPSSLPKSHILNNWKINWKILRQSLI